MEITPTDNRNPAQEFFAWRLEYLEAVQQVSEAYLVGLKDAWFSHNITDEEYRQDTREAYTAKLDADEEQGRLELKAPIFLRRWGIGI